MQLTGRMLACVYRTLGSIPDSGSGDTTPLSGWSTAPTHAAAASVTVLLWNQVLLSPQLLLLRTLCYWPLMDGGPSLELFPSTATFNSTESHSFEHCLNLMASNYVPHTHLIFSCFIHRYLIFAMPKIKLQLSTSPLSMPTGSVVNCSINCNDVSPMPQAKSLRGNTATFSWIPKANYKQILL